MMMETLLGWDRLCSLLHLYYLFYYCPLALSPFLEWLSGWDTAAFCLGEGRVLMMGRLPAACTCFVHTHII